MHAPFRKVFLGLHLLCILALVCPRRRDSRDPPAARSPPGANEIFQKARSVTMKFPRSSGPAGGGKALPRVSRRRRVDTNVEPVIESCTSKTFKTELNKLRQKVKCEPRDTVVDLVSPDGYVITPNAVIVKRCGGMCGGAKKCLPFQQREVKFYVKTIKNNQMHCSSITVAEDTKCKCSCKQKESNCKPNQIYSKERCACLCRNEKDYAQCVEKDNENLHWDESSCSCVCQQRKSCTTGTFWIESECRCQKPPH